MPKGKVFRRTLRITSLFFGSVKRNREKRSWILLILVYKYQAEERGQKRTEDVWNCRSQTREGVCLITCSKIVCSAKLVGPQQPADPPL